MKIFTTKTQRTQRKHKGLKVTLWTFHIEAGINRDVLSSVPT